MLRSTRLDNMELSDDDFKRQLGERLRIEEALKVGFGLVDMFYLMIHSFCVQREADRARVEAERVTLELRAAEAELQRFRVKMSNSAAEIERVRLAGLFVSLLFLSCKRRGIYHLHVLLMRNLRLVWRLIFSYVCHDWRPN